ncbi:MAG TPA: SMC-Scp complex subunit ScpB [Egicoccus sp.]|nr:SMC-Scp complex subunit ScpB [Egicoccus sp.]HSK24541.1 SMC-Scp complex subunit ScpB [Egicoccus sp.]
MNQPVSGTDDAVATGLPVVDSTATRPADADLRPGIEALLFLADEPLDPASIAEVVDRDVAEVEELLTVLQRDYAAAGGGIEIRDVAGGWRMYTAPPARPVLERWALAGRTGRLTQAALETLAVVAYKQPISRSEIGDIRGVSADGAVRSLVARGFVTEVGRDEGPGQAVLYGTTTLFLERLGLQSLDDLPALTDFLPEAPAPDEPEPGTLRDVRKRLAGGDDLPVRGVFEGRRTNTGGEDPDGDDEADDAMPAPTATVGARDTGEIDELTDRLEQAARNAVDRLRQAVAAGEDDGDDGDDVAVPPPAGEPSDG